MKIAYALPLLVLCGCEISIHVDSKPSRYMQFQPTANAKLILDLDSIKKKPGGIEAQSVYIFNPPLKQGDAEVRLFYSNAIYNCDNGTSTITQGITFDDKLPSGDLSLTIPSMVDTICNSQPNT